MGGLLRNINIGFGSFFDLGSVFRSLRFSALFSFSFLEPFRFYTYLVGGFFGVFYFSTFLPSLIWDLRFFFFLLYRHSYVSIRLRF